MPDSDKSSGDGNLADTLPIPIQIFLWRQVSPFVKPKLGKMHDESCIFCQHSSSTGHHDLKEACKTFEKVLVQNLQFGLKHDIADAIHSLPRWKLVQSSLPHVMHSAAALLFNRVKDGNIQSLNSFETKLMYTLHWIILDAAEECADSDFEKGEFHSSPFFYLFPIPTITLFVYLFAPICHHLKESDFQNFRLENGLKIWQGMWEFRHPEAACFSAHCKPKPKYLSGKHSKQKQQFGDVFLGHASSENFITSAIVKEMSNYQVYSFAYDRINELSTTDLPCGGYILVSNNDETIGNLFLLKFLYLNFKPHRKILIVSTTFSNIDAKSKKKALYLHDLDIIILQPSTFDIKQNETYFNLPQEITNWNVISLREKIQMDPSNQNITFNEESKWSPLKALKLSQHTFIVSFFFCPPYVMKGKKDYYGVDLNILKEITKGWPISYVFWGTNVWNPNYFYQVRKDVENRKSDIAMCAQWNGQSLNYDFDTSRYYAQQCLTFLVPRPKILPLAFFILWPFEINMWLSLITTFILFVSILYGISVLSNNIDKKFNHSRNSMLLDPILINIYCFRIISGGGIKDNPDEKPILRILVLCWYFVCILFTTYYATGLTISLRFPRLTPEVNNINDMIKYEVNWLGFTISKQVSQNEIMIELSKHSKGYTDGSVANKYIKEGYGLQVKIPSALNYVMVSELLDDYGRENLQLLSENLICYFCVYAFPKNSPFVDYFNRYLVKFQESGLIEYWHKDQMLRKENRYMQNFFKKQSKELNLNLTLENLQGAFYLLLIGIFIATLTFIAEILIAKQ